MRLGFDTLPCPVRVGQCRKSYLDVKILVNFDRLAKGIDILHEVRELPRVAQLLEHGLLQRWLR